MLLYIDKCIPQGERIVYDHFIVVLLLLLLFVCLFVCLLFCLFVCFVCVCFCCCVFVVMFVYVCVSGLFVVCLHRHIDSHTSSLEDLSPYLEGGCWYSRSLIFTVEDSPRITSFCLLFLLLVSMHCDTEPNHGGIISL